MESQNYANHKKFYYPHHFIFYPLALALAITSIVKYNNTGQELEYLLLAFFIFLLIWLSFMMRQHYALGLQNRIIRMELRLRYYQITGSRLETLENQLTFAQLAALRFASDEELVGLIEQTLKEDLAANTIKKLIKNWQPDYMRI
jgi:hypothetical protein